MENMREKLRGKEQKTKEKTEYGRGRVKSDFSFSKIFQNYYHQIQEAK